MKKDGIKRAIAFSQYPHYSCTTTGSSLNHLWTTLKQLNLENEFKWSLIDRWPTYPLYIDAIANRINQAIDQFLLKEPQEEGKKRRRRSNSSI